MTINSGFSSQKANLSGF
jgi:hypothetical protein